LVHLHEPMIPAVSFSLLVQEPAALVGTFHMAAPGPGWYRVFGPLARRLLGRLDARIAVSRSARDHVDAVAPAPCEIVPLGLDLPPAARRHAGDGPGRILFVGRPDPRKGLGVLLDAFARLPGTPHLDLVGVAPSAARAAAGSRGLNGRVHAYGRISDADRDALMQRADVFCSPALRSESFGLVLAEAMAAGLPVVASDVGGHADVVGRDTGALVPPGDPEATARALQGLLADPSERSRCGRAARERAQALAWDRIAARHLEIYERALRRRAGRLSAARSAATSAATQSRPAASGPAPH
jgi:phosphatidylinositol alpha-mannosyltransferase